MALNDDARKRADKAGKKLEMDHTSEELVAIAKANHIWLNAFSTIRPSDDFLIGIGRSVLSQLNQSKMVDDFVGLSAVTYIRVNAS